MDNIKGSGMGCGEKGVCSLPKCMFGCLVDSLGHWTDVSGYTNSMAHPFPLYVFLLFLFIFFYPLKETIEELPLYISQLPILWKCDFPPTHTISNHYV